MRADETKPDLFPPIRLEAEAASEADSDDEEAGESRLRPRDRRVIQAIALVCAVSVLLSVHWMDERNKVRKNLKPPEKVITVAPKEVAEFMGARWVLAKRENSRPTAGGEQQNPNGLTELRLTVGVRPESAAAAKAVGGSGIVYRLVGDEGREWSAAETSTKEPQVGVALVLTVKATVPRAVADSLELEIRAPKASRKAGEPLALLRFER